MKPDSPGCTRTQQVAVSEEQRCLAERAEATLGAWLSVGTAAAGEGLQGELARIVHEARAVGAHGLSYAGLRVLRATRALREARADFGAEALLRDLRRLGRTAHLLANHEHVSGHVLGQPRPEYKSIGSLRLAGLGCEPIITRGGYAGVTSYVLDQAGTIYTLSDVVPADASRALAAYEFPISMDESPVSHRDLTRSTLCISETAAAEEGRLRALQGVRAARTAETPSFAAGRPATLFSCALAHQLERAFDAMKDDRPPAAGETLLFLRGRVLGAGDAELILEVDDIPLRVLAADDHPRLAYRDNLRLLSELVDRELQLIGHIVPERPRSVTAIVVEAGNDALRLPASLGQRVNLGLDVLTRDELVEPRASSVVLPPSIAPDPLDALRRRLLALCLNGTRSLPVAAAPRIEAERAALRSSLMPSAADALGALAEACYSHSRGSKAETLARTFTAAACYEHSATLCLRQAAFTLSPSLL